MKESFTSNNLISCIERTFLTVTEDSTITYTTNAAWVSAIYDALMEANLDASELFNQFEISQDVRSNPELRVDVLKIAQLWAHVTKTTGNDAISLRATRHVNNTANTLTILGGASENLLDAVDKYIKYISAATTGITLSTHISDTFIIEIQPAVSGIYIGDEGIDAAMSRMTHLLSLASTPPIIPLRIELKRKKPKHIEAFNQTFQCPLHFEQNRNAVVFALDSVKQPFKTPNLTLALHMEQYLANYIKQQLPTDTTNQLIKNIFRNISFMLPEGKPTVSAMAKRLYMSDRTLQRKLKEHGVSFQELLNKARFDLASHYLKQGEHTIESISDLLGFSSYTSFIRFFKVVTGLTPKEFIKKHA